MPTDASINFATDTGYTYEAANVEFTTVSGALVARAKSLFSGTTVIVTPEIDRTAWALDEREIRQIIATVREPIGYYHSFIFAFQDDEDGDPLWMAWAGGEFYPLNPVDKTDLNANAEDQESVRVEGVTWEVLQNIRHWPLSDTIRFGIAVTKIDDQGYIDLISVEHGNRLWELTGDPDPLDVFEENFSIAPELPIKLDYISPNQSWRSHGGHEISIQTHRRMRRRYKDVSWATDSEATADALVAFFEAHQGEPFLWTPPGELSSIVVPPEVFVHIEEGDPDSNFNGAPFSQFGYLTPEEGGEPPGNDERRRLIVIFSLADYLGIPAIYRPSVGVANVTLTRRSPGGLFAGTPWLIRRLTREPLSPDQITYNEYETGEAWDTPGGDFTEQNATEFDWNPPVDGATKTVNIRALVDGAVSAGEVYLALIFSSLETDLSAQLVFLSEEPTLEIGQGFRFWANDVKKERFGVNAFFVTVDLIQSFPGEFYGQIQ